ncbi:hypothetical protein IQ266_22665 [filamentous cyanobacterium LEGE 11480]|uniref:Uncharacterized protein n=1 Tax=Romeriopsis navalis LEGE 11480 TaxID=2777977 RepID=A0A928VT50_9CYAN|nr:hypothetical protein [Romeriopsis navalis]MBE9032546.1 hypothetical protein [Romeriopsis navalis LEGE 11480]
MTNITLQLPDDLLQQVQALAGTDENLQAFLIGAIEHEVIRNQKASSQPSFWDGIQEIRDQMATDNIEIDPDEIWGNLRDRAVGREVNL